MFDMKTGSQNAAVNAGIELHVLVAAIFMLSAAPVAAQSARPVGGGFTLVPALEVSRLRSDNFFYENSGGETVGTLRIAPSVVIATQRERLNLEWRTSAEYGRFLLSGIDNEYVDGQTGLGIGWIGGERHRIKLHGDYQWGHDPYGTSRTAGAPVTRAELDTWEQPSGDLRYLFGASDALINLELSARGRSKTYTSNKAQTSVLDHRVAGAGAAAYFNISPKTSLLLDIAQDEIRFDQQAAGGVERNAEEARVRGGVRWKAAAKTTGDLRAGYFRRDANASGQRIADGVDWTASLNWTPLLRSSFTLQSGRSSQESYLTTVNVINNQNYGLDYKQQWGRWLTTQLTYTHTDSEFVGSAREDRLDTASLSVAYLLTRISTFFISGGRQTRDSTEPANNYEGNYFNVGLRLTP